MAETTTPEVVKETNDDRRIAALEAKRRKNHQWRVNTWARAEIAIRTAEDEIRERGGEPQPLYEPDFKDPNMLAQYAATPKAD